MWRRETRIKSGRKEICLLECLLGKKGEFLQLDTPILAIEIATERANGRDVGA